MLNAAMKAILVRLHEAERASTFLERGMLSWTEAERDGSLSNAAVQNTEEHGVERSVVFQGERYRTFAGTDGMWRDAATEARRLGIATVTALVIGAAQRSVWNRWGESGYSRTDERPKLGSVIRLKLIGRIDAADATPADGGAGDAYAEEPYVIDVTTRATRNEDGPLSMIDARLRKLQPVDDANDPDPDTATVELDESQTHLITWCAEMYLEAAHADGAR